jgi:hypothetical protein
VQFDDTQVHVHAEPEGKLPWSADFAWSTIIRVCFEARDLFTSDAIFIFTSERPESYVIPTEGRGGSEFFEELIRRGLFDAELAAQALRSEHGLFCWPPTQARP